jgi:copper chaperone CopZ
MKFTKHIKSILISPLIMAGFIFLPAEKSEAQIMELDQIIFGMDCAPCAKGVENRMKRMDGVQSAVLDLNKGEASLMFTGQHTTSLQQIQKSIIDGGFSPKEARIKVRGTLQQEGGAWQLITESGDLFLLEEADANFLASNNGQKIIVEGTVAENEGKERWHLTVHQLQPTG